MKLKSLSLSVEQNEALLKLSTYVTSSLTHSPVDWIDWLDFQGCTSWHSGRLTRSAITQ